MLLATLPACCSSPMAPPLLELLLSLPLVDGVSSDSLLLLLLLLPPAPRRDGGGGSAACGHRVRVK
jgi:hypothetical protein